MMFMNHKCNEVQSGEEEQLNALFSMVKSWAEGAAQWMETGYLSV